MVPVEDYFAEAKRLRIIVPGFVGTFAALAEAVEAAWEAEDGQAEAAAEREVEMRFERWLEDGAGRVTLPEPAIAFMGIGV
jgi:hypothetical protein